MSDWMKDAEDLGSAKDWMAGAEEVPVTKRKPKKKKVKVSEQPMDTSAIGTAIKMFAPKSVKEKYTKAVNKAYNKLPGGVKESLKQLESGALGAADTLTFGGLDELTGAATKAMGGDYKEGRDTAREIQKQKTGRRKGAAITGGVAGALALPLPAPAKIGKTVATGAAMGAGYGAGHADEMSDIPGKALLGAVGGGALSGAAGVAGKALSKGAQEALRGFADKQRIAQVGQGATPTQMQGLIDMRFPGGTSALADKLRSLGVKGIKTGSKAQDDVLAATEGSGARIAEIIDDLERQGGSVDPSSTIAELQSLVGKMKSARTPDARTIIRAAEKQIKLLQEGPLSPTGAQRTKQLLQKNLAPALTPSSQHTAKQAVAEKAAPSIRKALLEAVETQTPRGPEFRTALQESQISQAIRKISGKEEGKELARRMFSPTDYAAGIGGTAAAGPGGGIAATLLNKFVKGRERGIAASSAETLEKLLQSKPAVLGRYMTKLGNAAQQGAGALQASHFVLYSSDPEYRKAYDEASLDVE